MCKHRPFLACVQQGQDLPIINTFLQTQTPIYTCTIWTLEATWIVDLAHFF